MANVRLEEDSYGFDFSSGFFFNFDVIIIYALEQYDALQILAWKSIENWKIPILKLRNFIEYLN